MRVLEAAVIPKANIWRGNKMKKNAIKFKFTLGLLLSFFSMSIHAAPSRMDSANLFDSIVKLFHNTAHTWGHVILNYASWLFWSLALISMTWTFGFMMLRQADFSEFFAELIRFIVTLGFFYWIMLNGPLIATSIIDSLRQLAAQASGLEYTISPSDIVDVGFDIVSRTVDSSSIWSPGATMAGYIIAGVILVILVLVAMNMLIILISGWVVTYGGVFLLGFGGGRWTQDIAINYYRTILGIALQAFAMILIIGIGKSFIDQYFALMAKDILLKEMFIMLAVAIILLVLVNKIPPMIGAIVYGGGGGGGGGVGGSMGGMGLSGAMGAAGVAAGMAATGTGNVASQAAGGLSAIKSAYKAAAQTMGSESASQFTEQSSTSKLGGLANAMGQATAFASSFGSHLGSGIADVVRDKKDAFKGSVSESVSQSAGGKVASKISAKMNGGDNATQSESSNDATSSSVSNTTLDSSSTTNKNESAIDSEGSNVTNINSSNGDLTGGVGEGDEINLPNDNGSHNQASSTQSNQSETAFEPKSSNVSNTKLSSGDTNRGLDTGNEINLPNDNSSTTKDLSQSSNQNPLGQKNTDSIKGNSTGEGVGGNEISLHDKNESKSKEG